MKVILVEGAGDASTLRVGDAPGPKLRPGTLRLQVHATAVNRADLMQRRGLYPSPPGASPILGLECAGTVLEAAPDVRGWKPGDRAMALLPGGGYAEQVVVEAGCALPVPERLSLEQAAAVPEVFLTAYLNLFQLGGLEEAGSALVHGGGSGVGTAAIQLVKAAGATVIVTAGSEPKCRRCRELGADVAVNYRSEDFLAAARAATDDRGVDVVLDSIGAPYLERNLKALALDGRLVLIGLMGGATGQVPLGLLLLRRLHVIGSTLRARPVAQKAALVAAFRERFGRDLEQGRIAPVVDRVLPLADAGEAHRVMAASEHFGKIVLRVA